MTTVAFFNNKGGVGTTSLVYHLAWMYADLGLSVVAADLDPQSDLSSMFFDDERLGVLWADGSHDATTYGALQPLLEGTGDVRAPHVEDIGPGLALVVGDLALSVAEDDLSIQWPAALSPSPRPMRMLSAFARVLQDASDQREADLVLIDVGPNLGALNRASLIAAEWVVVPLASDLFSLQGLRNLGPTLRDWRDGWAERRQGNPVADLVWPSGSMRPAGYVVMQRAVRLDRPVKAYSRWMDRIPGVYREAVLGGDGGASTVSDDPNCLAKLKHYRSLMPMAQEARKPMFFLRPADGAIGGHSAAVQDCYRDFRFLALAIAERCGFDVPIARVSMADERGA